MESGVNAGSGAPCSYPQSWGTVPMLHYGVRRSVLVNLDLEVRVCFQQSLLHCPKEPSADSLIPSNQSTTFIQTFISCHLDPTSALKLLLCFILHLLLQPLLDLYFRSNADAYFKALLRAFILLQHLRPSPKVQFHLICKLDLQIKYTFQRKAFV